MKYIPTKTNRTGPDFTDIPTDISMNNLKFHTPRSFMYSESGVWSIFRHASGRYTETPVIYKD